MTLQTAKTLVCSNYNYFYSDASVKLSNQLLNYYTVYPNNPYSMCMNLINDLLMYVHLQIPPEALC